MTDEEYRKFLQWLYDEYVRNRRYHLRTFLERHGPPGDYWEMMRHLCHAVRSVRFMKAESENEFHTPSVFADSAMNEILQAIRHAASVNKDALDQSGILDALDAHLPQILEGLRAEHLPSYDVEILKDCGSRAPEAELSGLVGLAKVNLARPRSEPEDLESRLRSVEERLLSLEEQTDAPPIHGRSVRRWFKGMGQIGQGAALSIANVALAAGVIHFPVSPETQTWGAITSATTGVGMILGGIGDLRGE